ncbi:MAG: effector-binding domain-containing protein [Roseivirga sp.]|jgi:effector-binding domain-containing protein
MRIVKIILWILFLLFLIYVIVSFFLSGKYNVSREVGVNAPAKRIYAHVIDFKKWEAWSPWLQQDPTMKFKYEAQTSGVGANYTWTTEDDGGGKQSIKYASPYDTIRTNVAFDGMNPSNGLWTFKNTKNGTTIVKWGFSGELGFFSRILGLFMDEMIGESFEIGLANIKYLVETEKIEEAKFDVYSATLDSVRFYSIIETLPMVEIGPDFFARNFSKINAYLGKEMQNSNRPPFAIYHEWDEVNRKATVEVAIPLWSFAEGNKTIKKREMAKSEALFIDYYGSYENTGKAHQAINEYAKINQIALLDMGIEIFVTDPSLEEDTTLWLTKVVYPIAK